MYQLCETCGFDIRHNMFKRHVQTCTGRGPKYRRKAMSEEDRISSIKAAAAIRWQEAEWDDVPKSRRRERVLLEQEGVCAICSMAPEWLGKPLKFQMDHINGDSTNNDRSNLRLLCPNCHSQTETWGQANASETGLQRMKDAAIRGRVTRTVRDATHQRHSLSAAS